ncbi:MAG: hypothetical protein NWF00_10985 [Candidatus Bathyarchaeota archaeon]|nr:hypothetical protein [Candidatus Bathyarchaeota archaeon]
MQSGAPADGGYELLAAAEAYHELGISVLPFIIGIDGKKCPDCKNCPEQKWQQWQTRPQTKEEFEALHIENYQIFGLVCGTEITLDDEKVYLAGIDRDIKDPKISDEIKALTKTALNEMKPYTYREETRSQGQHLLYFSRKKVVGKKLNAIGMELLGEGNLVIVAPSRGYRSENDNTIAIVNDVDEIFYNALTKVGLYKKDNPTSGEVIAKSKPQQMRPCFKKLMEKDHLEHLEKVSLIYEMYYSGMSIAEVADAFQQNLAWEPPPEHTFNPKETASQISYTYKKAAEGNYRYKRETLQSLGLCFSECPLYETKDCRKRHPTIEEITKLNPKAQRISQGDLDDFTNPKEALEYYAKLLYLHGFSTREVRGELEQISKYKESTNAFKGRILTNANRAKEAEQKPDIDEPIESQADRLVKLCEKEQVELFHDQHQTAYSRFAIPCDIAINCDKNDVCSLLSGSQKHFCTHTNLENKQIQEHLAEKIVEQPDKKPQVAQISQYRNPKQQFKIMTFPLSSSHFKNWLALLMWKKEQKTPGSEGLNSALNVLKGKAVLEGKEHQLYNRVAPAPDGFWLDMADDTWRAIHITAQGWEIVENPPILFKRYSHQKPIAEPSEMTETEAAQKALRFLDFVNINPQDDSTKLALLITVISYFIPLIAHPAIVAHGPQGTAKSYLFKVIRRIVDPSSLELLPLSRDSKELIQNLDHHYCAMFDNVSYLTGEASDTLCRAVTGGGNSKRELFTNNEDIIYNFKRCIGLNGINIAAQRGDLLDRSLLVALVKIITRKTEAELDAELTQVLPEILGAFLTILSAAIRIKVDMPKPSKYFRLADWTEWSCAIALALGRKQDDFIEAYTGKVQLQNEEALNASPLALALLSYCKKYINTPINLSRPKWQGTATELLKALESHAILNGIIDTQSKKKSNFPTAPNALSRAINRVTDALAAVGCIVETKEGTPRRVIIDAEGVEPEPTQPVKEIPKMSRDTMEGHTCSKDCGTFRKAGCPAPSFQYRAETEPRPLKCDGFKEKVKSVPKQPDLSLDYPPIGEGF